MAHGHKFTDLVHHGVFVVAIISILIVVLERQLPPQPDLAVTDLPEAVQAWRSKGHFVEVFGRKMFVLEAGDKTKDKDAVIFFHGFPTSSFDYVRALPMLEKAFAKKRLVFFDHIGFGFSDKPQDDYDFTLHDHAENALELMRLLKIKSASIVAHDMGDSVLTEVLTRRDQKLLPEHFNNFFKNVVFTNGGMHYDLINQRITQRLFNFPYVGPFLSSLSTKVPKAVLDFVVSRQLTSIWGPVPDEAAEKRKAEDIEAMAMLTRFNGGQSISHKTISYLKDRARFESRWYRALANLDIPCLLFWGDSDAVSPTEIPKYLATNVLPKDKVTGKFLQKTGHFLMLEKPSEWATVVSDFVNNQK